MSDNSMDDQSLIRRSALSQTGPGIVFVEARLKDDSRDLDAHVDICSRLETIITDQFVSLELGKELLNDDRGLYSFPESLVSIKAVEYTGQNPAASSIVRLTDVTKVRVQLYRMHSGTPEPEDTSFSEALLHAEVITLPSPRFDKLWETLIFQEDLRNSLVLTLTNMVKFAKRLGSNNSQMNRLVLLYGHPGTGKSSLCQALAQKISIRLQFKSTKLVQINAATLLSKYFSESALQINNIFVTIEKICQSNDDIFVCVLIDEIESLAASRTAAAGRNETHDSIRATNALLTGLDRVKSQPNLIILCTSNLIKTLDAAFMDRCGLVVPVHPPSITAAYEIIRGGLRKLINAKIIESESDVPSFRDAQLTLLSKPEDPSSRLFKIVEELLSLDQACLVDGMVVSGRFLGQLAEQALTKFLREDSCSLQRAINFIDNFLKSQRRKGWKRKFRETIYLTDEETVKEKVGLTAEEVAEEMVGETVKEMIEVTIRETVEETAEETIPESTPPPAIRREESPPPTATVTATAILDYTATEEDELSFEKGTKITLLSSKEAYAWWRGSYNGQQGVFPSSYVKRDKSTEAKGEA